MIGGADLAAAARLVVGAALAIAAAGKLADRRAAAARTEVLLGPIGPVVAGALPLVEVLLAVALLAWWVPVPGILTIGLLVAFTFVLGRAARRGVPCPCFGPGSSRPPGRRDFIRNGLLFAGAILATGSPVGAAPVATASLAVGFAAVLIGIVRSDH
ncbi:MAG: MauE/DoxX family redox-associated membrane protein [Actinomycetota bacterium]